MVYAFFFFKSYGLLRDLHSFPTRRSSDLSVGLRQKLLGLGLQSLFWVRPSFAADLLRSEEHTSELQSPMYLVCRLLLEKKNTAQLLNSTSATCDSSSH